MAGTIGSITRGRAFAALAMLAAVASALVFAAADATAATRICRQIERELASLSSGSGGGSSEARRYDRAIEAQRGQIDKARRQLRRSGCGGFFSNGDESSCSSLGTAVDRMQRNLTALQRKRTQLGGSGGGNSRRERARLQASYNANDCGTGGPVQQDYAERERGGAPSGTIAPGRGGNIFEQLFGGGVRQRDSGDDTERVRTVVRPGSSDYSSFGGGHYRTLCVRTCDGYYFPISHSSSRDEFERDEQNCQTMCPGAEVKLYSHRVPDEESEAMVGLDGSAYVDLPNAFKYRDASFTRPASCGCNPVKNFSIIAGGGPAPAVEPVEAEPLVAPMPRPDPASDPETLANRAGGLDGKVVQRMLTSKPVAGLSTGERKVRVVGPEFLPDPEAALDLRAPAQRAIQ